MIQTKLATCHEIHCFIPVMDLAQLILKDRFNPNAKIDCGIQGTGILLVQYDRTERDEEPFPPSAHDPGEMEDR